MQLQLSCGCRSGEGSVSLDQEQCHRFANNLIKDSQNKISYQSLQNKYRDVTVELWFHHCQCTLVETECDVSQSTSNTCIYCKYCYFCNWRRQSVAFKFLSTLDTLSIFSVVSIVGIVIGAAGKAWC